MAEEIVKGEQPAKVKKVVAKESKEKAPAKAAKESKEKAPAKKEKVVKAEPVVETPAVEQPVASLEKVEEEVELAPVTVAADEKLVQVEVKDFETSKPQIIVGDVEPALTLSKHAQGWKDWLAYQQITPQDWLKRYPTHKMKHFVEEIIAFNAQKGDAPSI